MWVRHRYWILMVISIRVIRHYIKDLNPPGILLFISLVALYLGYAKCDMFNILFALSR